MNAVKNIFKNTTAYFFQILISIWPAFLIGNGLVGLLLSLILENQNRLIIRLCETVACVIIVCVCLFMMAYRKGYKNAQFNLLRSLLSLVFALGLHLLYANIFHFTEYTTGGAYYLAHIFYAGRNQSITFVYSDVPPYIYMLSICITDCFYIAASILGEKIGQEKRLDDRNALHGVKKRGIL